MSKRKSKHAPSSHAAHAGLDRKFEFILENLQDHSIFLVDITGNISSWNEGSERVFGFKESEILGKPFSIIFTPQDIQAGIPSAELSLALKEGKAEDERWHQRKDGTRFWASGAVLPLKRKTGKSHFIKVVRDATDRKRADDADRMESIGRLAGGVAHDYNNILTSILGYCQLLTATVPGEGQQHAWLGEIKTAADRAAALTRDLLSFSRKQMIAPEPVSLNEVIGKMNSLFTTTLGSHVHLITDLDPELEDVLLDRGQIQQVLLNLALNAREAMPTGGEVYIRTLSAKAAAKLAMNDSVAGGASSLSQAKAVNSSSADSAGQQPRGPSGETAHIEIKEFITLTFADTGKGMDVETTTHAFDPFYSTKPKAAGSVGLGLSTGYGIIQQSGGTISVTSFEEEGTRFEIRLPVHTEVSAGSKRDQPVAPNAAKVSPIAVKRTETILLVEDETSVRNLVSQLLQRSGYRILEAKDGEEGLAVYSAEPDRIDLVITDVIMPKLGGVGMAREIIARKPEAIFVFMSGYSEESLSDSGIPESRFAFLHKPFTAANLMEKIDEVRASIQSLSLHTSTPLIVNTFSNSSEGT
ncbi:MAG: PAS domain S-box protein [Fibrobacterota bacterium]|nr:PAS domain S-box protein [Fibrobacterota bacterium]